LRGTADLPLHGGKAPPWLFKRMVMLARGITEIMVMEYGQRGFLERISDPFWFQSLSCVLGFDWHSSGTTTVTTGALKEAIDPEELGIAIAGGKGRASRRTPEEILKTGEQLGLSDSRLTRFQKISRLAAKVDNALVQDTFQLYHHTFFLTEKGDWAVIQQGMNSRYARRYHWFDSGELIEEPHTAILGDRARVSVLNLTASESRENRRMELDLVKEGPERVERLYRELNAALEKQRTGSVQTSLGDWVEKGGQNKPQCSGGHGDERNRVWEIENWRENGIIERMGRREKALVMPMRINWDALKEAYEFSPANYEELIELKGVGLATIRALALIGELVYGTEASWRDPVKFSFAVGGKDGVPYPVDRKAMDESIEVLRQGIEQAKAGDKVKLRALERLRGVVPPDRKGV